MAGPRRNRKGTDEEILRLNRLGLSLATIADIIGCHPTAITLRLRNLNVPATDTRRSFMEHIYSTMSAEHQNWLANQLSPEHTIRDYITKLMNQDYQNRKDTP